MPRAFGSTASISGMAKAAVLPLPVCARPTTSSPLRSAGSASAWMGVGVSHPWSVTAFRTCSETGRSVNEPAGPRLVYSASNKRFLPLVVCGSRHHKELTSWAATRRERIGTGHKKRDALQASGISMIMDVCSRLRSMPSIPDACPHSNG
jgi:hypothetical protein